MASIQRYLLLALMAALGLIVAVYFNLVPIDNVPAWAALILSLFGIYYTSESLIMDVKIKHSEDLHKFITEWKNRHEGFYYKVIPDMGTVTGRSSVNMNKLQYGLDFINEDVFYDDIIKNHLEKNYKDLKEKWPKYNKLVSDFENVLNQANGRVEKIALAELKKKGIEPKIDYGFYGIETITPSFTDQLLKSYADAVGRQQLSMQETNYSIPGNPGEPGKTMKGYNVIASTGPGYQIYIAYATTPEMAQKYMSVFDSLQESKMLSDTELKRLHSSIKTMDNEIDDLYKKILQLLINLGKYPVFGEKCDFVQRAL